MFRCHPIPSYLLLVTAILATSGRGASLCRQDQSAALLSLKASFRFDNNSASYYCGWVRSPALPSWKAGTNCCTWQGVTCDGTSSGYVTALNLSFLCISGNLSSPDIFKLTSLRFLSLAYNNFDASPWPSPGFEQLKELKYLDLSYSGLSGDLPIENGQLSSLVTLNLSGLHLKDLNFETLIDSLGSLQTLYLDEAYIPVHPTNLPHASSANTMSSLRELSMWGCTITNGQFDTFLFDSKLANLVMLDLSDFDLKNLSLYSLIGSLGELQNLYLGNVTISVSPTDLAYAPSTNTTSGLKELHMLQCTITSGNFDTVLTFLSNLIVLELFGLDLKNLSLDALINNLGSLHELSMTNCGLIGTIPSWIFHIKSLTVLDVSWNENLCGELPEFIEGSALQELSLSGTKFSGKIPESIGNLRNLTMLDLYNCQFNGTIPHFDQWPMIQWIDLSGNSLIGSLPSDGYHALRNLTTVYLSNNSISGVIPASLFSHPSLQSLDLSQNNFTGNFLLYPNISSNLSLLILVITNCKDQSQNYCRSL